MSVEFLWNAAFWKTAAEFAPIVTTGIALAAAIIALCAIRLQRTERQKATREPSRVAFATNCRINPVPFVERLTITVRLGSTTMASALSGTSAPPSGFFWQEEHKRRLPDSERRAALLSDARRKAPL